jgi:hypothetical protein
MSRNRTRTRHLAVGALTVVTLAGGVGAVLASSSVCRTRTGMPRPHPSVPVGARRRRARHRRGRPRPRRPVGLRPRGGAAGPRALSALLGQLRRSPALLDDRASASSGTSTRSGDCWSATALPIRLPGAPPAVTQTRSCSSSTTRGRHRAPPPSWPPLRSGSSWRSATSPTSRRRSAKPLRPMSRPCSSACSPAPATTWPPTPPPPPVNRPGRPTASVTAPEQGRGARAGLAA